MGTDFIQIMSGPSSYPTGGFEFGATQYEKIQDACVTMHPTTALATNQVPGFVVSLSASKAAATVKIMRLSITDGSVWTELAAGTNLAEIKFCMSGEAV